MTITHQANTESLFIGKEFREGIIWKMLLLLFICIYNCLQLLTKLISVLTIPFYVAIIIFISFFGNATSVMFSVIILGEGEFVKKFVYISTFPDYFLSEFFWTSISDTTLKKSFQNLTNSKTNPANVFIQGPY